MKDLEIAYKEAAILDLGYGSGWGDAKKFYRDEFLMLYDEHKHNGTVSLTLEDINNVFNEVPEDEMEILRKAALNRGQP